VFADSYHISFTADDCFQVP